MILDKITEKVLHMIDGEGFEGGAGESGSFEFRFTSDISPESKLLMNSLILGLQNIERDYGKSYINVKFKEV